jgi:hypothetical protein
MLVFFFLNDKFIEQGKLQVQDVPERERGV